MQKITFENLPSTDTPINASNLNTLQDNVEDAIDSLMSNTYGTSQTEGYCQEYINNNVGVVESGSNTNGSYIKYADGTMICWGYFGQTFTEGQWGSLWEYSLVSTVNFPAEFVGNISINANLVQGQDGGTGAISKINYNNSGIFAMNVIRPTQYSSKLFYVSYIAIGKWK